MINIIQTLKNKYYRYQPGDFIVIRVDGQISNMRDFHKYRIKWIIKNHSAFVHQLTHQRG